MNKKALSCYTLSIITALCLTVLWPYYNFFASLMTIASGEMQKTMDYSLTREYLYSKPLLRSGAALAGIPIALYYLMKRQYLLLWGGSLLFGLLYLYGFYSTISLAERCVFFMLCLLQIAASRLCREWSAKNAWTSQHLGNKIFFTFLVFLLVGGYSNTGCAGIQRIYSSFLFFCSRVGISPL